METERRQMMEKLEKVIKGLTCHVHGNPQTRCHKCPYWGTGPHGLSQCSQLFADALALLNALLKAQEPVKPTRYQEGRWFKTWRCGACGGTLVFRNGEDKPKYCTDCGKAVKWE